MTRGASPAFLTALQDQVTRPALFFEGVFGANTIRFWSGLGDIVWNSVTWTGAGTLIGLSSIDEPTDIVAAGFSVSLSGIPTDLVSAVMTSVVQGNAGRIWVGLIDSSGVLIVSPVLAASGRADVPSITDNADTCTIEVTYEGRLIDLQRSREWRYTHESQQQVYPGDLGFQYVAALQNKELIWGAASPTGAATAPPRAAPAAAPAQVQNNPYRDSGGNWIGSNGSPVRAAPVDPQNDQYHTNGVWVGNKNN